MNTNTAKFSVVNLALITAVLAAGAVWQLRRNAEQSRAIASLREELKAANLRLAEITQHADAAGQRARMIAAESEALRRRLAENSQATAAAPASEAQVAESETADPAANDAPGKALSSMLGKMMKDPEMKKMMAAQQGMVVRQMYSDFVKEARLSPAEAEKFFELLASRQAQAMESASEAMNGGDTTALHTRTKAGHEDFRKEMKAMFGDAREAEFESFEKTVGDRVMVSQFAQQISSPSNALTPEQSKGLVQIMSAERANDTSTTFAPGDMGALAMSDSDADQFFQKEAAIQKRVLARAGSLLTPAQKQDFERFQTQQLEMQKVGMKMGRQMFQEAE